MVVIVVDVLNLLTLPTPKELIERGVIDVFYTIIVFLTRLWSGT